MDSLNASNFDEQYEISIPKKSNRFSFRPMTLDDDYLNWPKLTDLSAVSPITEYQENRRFSLIEDDKDVLRERMKKYFDSEVDWEELEALDTGLTKDAARFDAKNARIKVLKE